MPRPTKLSQTEPLHKTFVGELLHVSGKNNPMGRRVFRQRLHEYTGRAWGEGTLSKYESGAYKVNLDLLAALLYSSELPATRFWTLVKDWAR